jgi:hypothetical protein
MSVRLRVARRLFASASISALCAFALGAQGTASISGRILSSDGNRPLADVILRLDGTPRSATSGADGRYRLAALPPGEYVLTARLLGYDEARRSVTLTPGATVAWAQKSAEAHAHEEASRPDMRNPAAVMGLPTVGQAAVHVRHATLSPR